MTIIDINIAPPNVRKKKSGNLLKTGFKIPLEVVIGLGGGLLMLLVLVHFYLLFANLSKLGQHKTLKKEWDGLLDAKQNVDVVIAEMKSLKEKKAALDTISGGRYIMWSKKLNLLSDNMPQGVWLNRIAYNGESLFIGGSAISRKENELLNAHSLVANLKSDKDFQKHVESIDMGSIQRRLIGKNEIADFIVNIILEK